SVGGWWKPIMERENSPASIDSRPIQQMFALIISAPLNASTCRTAFNSYQQTKIIDTGRAPHGRVEIADHILLPSCRQICVCEFNQEAMDGLGIISCNVNAIFFPLPH